MVTDVHVALVDITASAREYIRLSERQGRGRQGNECGAVTCVHRGNTQARHEIGALLGGGRSLKLLRLVAPTAISERPDKRQQRPKSEPSAASTTTPSGLLLVCRRFGRRLEGRFALSLQSHDLVHATSSPNTPWEVLPSWALRGMRKG